MHLISRRGWASGLSVVEVLAGLKVLLEPGLDGSTKAMVGNQGLVLEPLVGLGVGVVDLEPGLNGAVLVAVAGRGGEGILHHLAGNGTRKAVIRDIVQKGSHGS